MSEKRVDEEQREGRADRRLHPAVLVLEVEENGGDDVEVGGHRGHQGPAKAREHANRADDSGLAAILMDEDRKADRGRHHREGGEGIAHDHGEKRHTDREGGDGGEQVAVRSEEHTSELQSLMRISYAVFCLKKKKNKHKSKRRNITEHK